MSNLTINIISVTVTLLSVGIVVWAKKQDNTLNLIFSFVSILIFAITLAVMAFLAFFHICVSSPCTSNSSEVIPFFIIYGVGFILLVAVSLMGSFPNNKFKK